MTKKMRPPGTPSLRSLGVFFSHWPGSSIQQWAPHLLATDAVHIYQALVLGPHLEGEADEHIEQDTIPRAL